MNLPAGQILSIHIEQPKILTLFIPILLYTSAPVHFLFDFHQFPLLFALIIAVVLTNIILRKFWNYSLESYNSASS